MFNLFIQCYTKKFLQFKGRSGKKEYISFILFYFLIGLLLNVISTISGIDIYIVSYLLLFIQIISFLPILNLTTRRLHDIGYSGFIQLILIAIILLVRSDQYINFGIILGLTFCVLLIFFKGTPGTNKYGEPPEY